SGFNSTDDLAGLLNMAVALSILSCDGTLNRAEHGNTMGTCQLCLAVLTYLDFNVAARPRSGCKLRASLRVDLLPNKNVADSETDGIHNRYCGPYMQPELGCSESVMTLRNSSELWS